MKQRRVSDGGLLFGWVWICDVWRTMVPLFLCFWPYCSDLRTGDPLYSKFTGIQPCKSCINGSYVRIGPKEVRISVNSGTSVRMDSKGNENQRMADPYPLIGPKEARISVNSGISVRIAWTQKGRKSANGGSYPLIGPRKARISPNSGISVRIRPQKERL